jgi:hypothetical protein
MMQFFQNDTKLSMGRLLSFSLFVIVTAVFCYRSFVDDGVDIPANITSLIQWGWITAIGGKAIQAAAERIKK